MTPTDRKRKGKEEVVVEASFGDCKMSALGVVAL